MKKNQEYRSDALNRTRDFIGVHADAVAGLADSEGTKQLDGSIVDLAGFSRMIDQVGGLDERFHMYGEDDEWCLRITRAGWLLVFEPDAAVVHHGGQFSLLRWDSSEKLRVKLNSSFDFQRRCEKPADLILRVKKWPRSRGAEPHQADGRDLGSGISTDPFR